MLPNQIIARVLALFEAGEFVRVCAWCARVNLDDDWLPMPQVALDAIHVRERITHSICPDCTQALLAELREPNATR